MTWSVYLFIVVILAVTLVGIAPAVASLAWATTRQPAWPGLAMLAGVVLVYAPLLTWGIAALAFGPLAGLTR